MMFSTRSVAFFLVLSLFAPTAFAADGDLDPTFNGTDIVITDNRPFEEAHDLVIQPDGKIVVAGAGGEFSFIIGVSQSFQVARYNPDGSLDATFGTGGIVTMSAGGNNSAERRGPAGGRQDRDRRIDQPHRAG
jgi:uncharacterized delta-60 repeat protein